MSAEQESRPTYQDIREETEKPASDRETITSLRGNKIAPRRYHLTDKKISALVSAHEKDGSFPNPYRYGGMYYGMVQALIELGVDKVHSFVKVKEAIKSVLVGITKKNGQNAWESFVTKAPKNDLSGKDVNGRLLQNASVLQRLTGLHPYGEKLRQVLACIDILKDANDLPCIRLNTEFKTVDSVCPINEIHRKRGRKKGTVSKAPDVVIVEPANSVEIVSVELSEAE